jgi:mono/diheme cytochrome c family protein
LKLLIIGLIAMIGTAMFAQCGIFVPIESAKAARAKEKAAMSRSLFFKHCAACHGADGRGQTPKGMELDTPDITGGAARRMSVKRVTNLITNGDGDMPGFRKKLTKTQIASLVSYARKL